MKKITILLFFAFISCNRIAKVNEPFDDENGVSSFSKERKGNNQLLRRSDCQELVLKLNRLPPCERLDAVDSLESVLYPCLGDVVYVFYTESNIAPNVKMMEPFGLYYDSMDVYYNDLRIWRRYFGCDTVK